MSNSENLVYTPADVRAMDRTAIDKLDIPGYTLMTRAAQATFDDVRERFAHARRWLVICGAGNNAGDGYAIAMLAHNAGLDVSVASLADPATLTGDAATALTDFRAAGAGVVDFDPALCAGAELIVDALLGTGLDRELTGDWRDAVDAINGADAPVVAVDVPTGLHAETGEIMGAAIHAALTVTFVAYKQGLFIGHGPARTGELRLHGLGIPADARASFRPTLRIFTGDDLRGVLAPRVATDHKGRFGHVLVIGGNRGMAGAPRLAGEAALRVGAGLVSVAAHPDSAASIVAGRPELMCRGVASSGDLDALLERATVVALGPGLGRDEWARQLFARVMACSQPRIIDADALNLLAEMPSRRDNWILTPHPGEAGRLLGTDSASVQADRVGAVAEIAARYGGIVVLKGHGTLIGAADALTMLVRRGNPGMATAGTGDVLTGATAGLLAQFPDVGPTIAAAAAYAHGVAGDRAAAAGQRGLLAGDLMAELRAVVNPA